MDKSIFLYWWFSFDLQYYLILSGTNNVLHTSVKKILCTLWSLALAKKSCNNINNSCAQVSRLCYFLWLCLEWRQQRWQRNKNETWINLYSLAVQGNKYCVITTTLKSLNPKNNMQPSKVFRWPFNRKKMQLARINNFQECTYNPASTDLISVIFCRARESSVSGQ